MFTINQNNIGTFSTDREYLNSDELTICGIDVIPTMFIRNKNIKRLDIRDAQIISAEAFIDLYNLELVQFDNNLLKIGYQAFANAYNLKKVVWGENIKEINCFQGSGLIDITLPESIEDIGSSFQGCKELQNIVLNNNITVLNEMLFYDDYSLKTLDVSPNLSVIEDNVFVNCKSLYKIKIIGDDNSSLDDCHSLAEIGSQAFYGTKAFTVNLAIPNLKILGEQAFRLSGITGWVSSNTLWYIGELCFAYCNNMETGTGETEIFKEKESDAMPMIF